MIKTAIGQDSHRFEADVSTKPLVLGGITFDGCPGLSGNSDADVVLHAITNAVSGISGINILGAVSDTLCMEKGITDSSVYLRKALDTLSGYRVSHVSMTIEAARPKFADRIEDMKKLIADTLGLSVTDVGITATSGEKLTAFGRGEGIQVFVIITAIKESS